MNQPIEQEYLPIRYKDLSPALKTLVVLAWIFFGIYALAIIIGLVSGVVTGGPLP